SGKRETTLPRWEKYAAFAEKVRLVGHGEKLPTGPVRAGWWGGVASEYSKGDARALIAREHRFYSCYQFAGLAEALSVRSSPVAQFEAGAAISPRRVHFLKGRINAAPARTMPVRLLGRRRLDGLGSDGVAIDGSDQLDLLPSVTRNRSRFLIGELVDLAF